MPEPNEVLISLIETGYLVIYRDYGEPEKVFAFPNLEKAIEKIKQRYKGDAT
jgi:hypothetical protein